MGSAAGALLISVLFAAPLEEAEPNTPTSVVRPATAVVTSPGQATDPKTAAIPRDSAEGVREPAGSEPAMRGPGPLPAADSISAPDHAPITISSRRSKPADSSAGDEDLPKAPAITWWTTTGIGLAAVLSLLFVGSRLIRRVVPGGFVGDAVGPIHLLYRTYLTPKHSVCLVKCGERILLVGISGERMQTLSEIHDPQEIDYLRGQLMQVRPRSASQAFRDAALGIPGAESQSDKQGDRDRATSPTFADRLAVLRDRISEWKSKAKAT